MSTERWRVYSVEGSSLKCPHPRGSLQVRHGGGLCLACGEKFSVLKFLFTWVASLQSPN